MCVCRYEAARLQFGHLQLNSSAVEALLSAILRLAEHTDTVRYRAYQYSYITIKHIKRSEACNSSQRCVLCNTHTVRMYNRFESLLRTASLLLLRNGNAVTVTCYSVPDVCICMFTVCAALKLYISTARMVAACS
jgi:hypothetical protein